MIDNDEVLEFYFRRQEVSATTGDIDPIDPAIVGRAHVRRLLHWARSRSTCPWLAASLAIPSALPRLRTDPEPVPAVYVSAEAARHLDEIVPLLRETSHRGNARCGLFLLPKASGLLRVIFDARPANCLLAPVGGLRLFSLEELFACWRHTRHVRVMDFRHQFYQIPLRGPLGDFFVVEVGRQRFVPVALPMGFHDAPPVGQAVSWAVTLFREDTESDLGAIFPQGPTMPSSVALRDTQGSVAGHILVLIDGVAVFHRSELAAEMWVARIQRNADRFCLRIKDVTANTFCGVTFDSVTGGWRSSGGLRPWSEPLTNREVFSILGSMLWEMRVRGESLLDHEALMTCWSTEGSQPDFSLAHHLDATFIGTLRDLWHRRQEDRAYRAWDVPPLLVPSAATHWVVTDATPTGTGALLMLPGGGIIARISRLDRPPADQAVYEMLALVEAVESLPGRRSVLAAVDAEVVRRCVDKRYSRSPALRALLRRLFAHVCGIRVVHIAGVENPADELSRGLEAQGPLWDAKLAETLARLREVCANSGQ